MTSLILNVNNTTTIPLSSSGAVEPIVNTDLRNVLEHVIYAFIFAFSVLGVATNGINIRVFIHQGLFSDSNTTALFFLAITDFAGCLFEIAAPICLFLQHTDRRPLFFACTAWSSLIGHTSHMLMSRITCWVTVYIAVERSLCVLMPFKVKRLMRPRITTSCITLIYVAVISAYIPFYANTRVVSVHSNRLNTTVSLLTQSPQGVIAAYYISLIFNIILSSSAIVIVAIATGLMMYKLMMSRKWRKSMLRGNVESNPMENTQSKRDREILKTVTLVTGLFLVCTLMSQIPGIAFTLVRGATPAGLNKNLFYVVYGYKVLFDLINSSLNYFFYIRFSSRFKETFQSLFRNNKTKILTSNCCR